jgi:hypothetical protein
VHQQLLDALIGAGGVITKISLVGPPVAVVLKSVEKVVEVSCIYFAVRYPGIMETYY